MIPKAALAAVLLVVGYKLAKPALFKDLYAKGKDQFLPFIITIAAILMTDLLIGITVGIVVGLYFVIKSNLHQAITVQESGDNKYLITLEKDVSFLNKAFSKKKHFETCLKVLMSFLMRRNLFLWITIFWKQLRISKATAINNQITVEIKPAKNSNSPQFADV